MDIKELRIGNHVLVDVEIVEVEAIGGYTCIDDLFILCTVHNELKKVEKGIEPVPITQELLKELGFEEEKNNLHYDYAIRYDNAENLCLFIVCIKEGLIRIEAWDDYRHLGNMLCSFLHELETFVYLTTKKELNYGESI